MSTSPRAELRCVVTAHNEYAPQEAAGVTGTRLRACVRALTATSHLSSALFGKRTAGPDTLLACVTRKQRHIEAPIDTGGRPPLTCVLHARSSRPKTGLGRPTNFPKTPINQPPFAMHYLPVRRDELSYSTAANCTTAATPNSRAAVRVRPSGTPFIHIKVTRPVPERSGWGSPWWHVTV